MIQIVIIDLPQLEAFLRNLERQCISMTPALEKAREEFEDLQDTWFATSGGGSWRPLSFVTTRKRQTSGPILVDTGDLQESFKRGGSDHYESRSGTHIETGSQKKYASPHHFGFRNFGTVPKMGDIDRPIKMRGKWVGSRAVMGESQMYLNNISNAFLDELFRHMGI